MSEIRMPNPIGPLGFYVDCRVCDNDGGDDADSRCEFCGQLGIEVDEPAA